MEDSTNLDAYKILCYLTWQCYGTAHLQTFSFDWEKFLWSYSRLCLLLWKCCSISEKSMQGLFPTMPSIFANQYFLCAYYYPGAGVRKAVGTGGIVLSVNADMWLPPVGWTLADLLCMNSTCCLNWGTFSSTNTGLYSFSWSGMSSLLQSFMCTASCWLRWLCFW